MVLREGIRLGLRKKHFYSYANDEIRMANRPQTVSESAFKDILKYWNYKEAKAEMERMETQESEDGTQSSADAFAAVMGTDHPCQVRLYGHGVTKNHLKQKAGDFGPSSNIVDEMVQKRMDEMEERMQQVMLENFNPKIEAIERDVTMNIIVQLQCLNRGLTLDPNMLRFIVRSSGEKAAIQPINHPSTGSNNQGVGNEESEESSDEDLT